MTDFPLAVARPSADEIQAHRSSFGGAGHLTHRRTAELQLIKRWLGHLCSAVEQWPDAYSLPAGVTWSSGVRPTAENSDDDDDVQLELAG